MTSGEVLGYRRGAPRKAQTLSEDYGRTFLARALEIKPAKGDFTWPSPKYQLDPLGFFRDILGVDPWQRERDILEAVRTHKRVAVSSGHKVSKSHSAAGLALWFYCSFEDARAVFTSTTSRQVDQILWRELKMLRARAGRCVRCRKKDERGPRPCPHSAVIPEMPHELARSGMKSPDFREVVGFTAREAEAVAGVSGKNLLYIVDEASGVPDEIFTAIEGNRAGGARIVMFSNPTRAEGEFFEAFHSKAELYTTLTISSEESPNVVAGRDVIPGLATRDWIEEKKREWGVESAEYKVRVLGQFATKDDRKILSLHDLAESEKRWLAMETDLSERLFVGLDPAGAGNAGDETAFAQRRGLKILRVDAIRGLSEDAILVHLLAFLRAERQLREEPPVVVVDREGPIGARVYGLLRDHAERNPADFLVIGVRSSERAVREPRTYGSVRDELLANLADWITKQGGAIPEDAKLFKDLHTPEFIASGIPERLRATPKKDLRKFLGRSPDRGDAVALAVWDSPSMLADAETNVGQEQRADPELGESVTIGLDPYAAMSTWDGRR